MDSPYKHAFRKLQVALETGRMEFVQDAHAILDGAINGNKEKPVVIPFQPRTASDINGK